MPTMPDLPPGTDDARANVARVYDYLLGGTHNYLVDQDLARQIAAAEPSIRVLAQANRSFLGRAVRTLCAAGVRQFLDIGSGIPTQGNVHEVAQRADPSARVVYADIDPIAIAHSKAVLEGNPNAVAIRGDLRDPEAILGAARARGLLDLSQPVGLLLVAVLHFIPDDGDPWQLVARLRDALPAGSYLVLSHSSRESQPDVAQALEKVYNSSLSVAAHPRSHADVHRFFDGFDVLDPGVVSAHAWRPDGADGPPAEASRLWHALAGVGVRAA